jgi:hypothetical protein
MQFNINEILVNGLFLKSARREKWLRLVVSCEPGSESISLFDEEQVLISIPGSVEGEREEISRFVLSPLRISSQVTFDAPDRDAELETD